METVTKEHNLDVESLKLSRRPLTDGAQIGDSASQQLVGSSQEVGAAKESKSGNETGTPETDASTKAPTCPGSGGQDMHQGSAAADVSDGSIVFTGKSRVSLASGANLPSKEQLKQLRAQCAVFVAFRNGLVPKKLHLEIALGKMYYKEDGNRMDLIDQKGKEQLVCDQSCVTEVPRSLERQDSSKCHPSILDSNSSKELDFSDEINSQPPKNGQDDKRDNRC